MTGESTTWWGRPGGGREVLRVAWPLIVSNAFLTLQLTLDRLFLSKSSTDEMAACMAAAMLFWTPVVFLQWVVNYCTTFVAQYHGAGRPERVGPAVWQSVHLSVVAGVGFLALVPLWGPLTRLAGHPEKLRALEETYLFCLSFSTLPILLTAATTGYFAGLGRSKTVLVVNAVGLAVNASLDYVLIFGECGFPVLGIAGAGWATVAGCWVSALVGLGLFLGDRPARVHATRAGWRPDLVLVSRLLRYGGPNGVVVCLETLGFTLFLLFVGRMGEVALGASTVAFTLNMPAYLPTVGIGQAVGVLVGQRLGEGRPDLAMRASRTGLVMAVAFAALVAVFYVTMPGPLVELFRETEKTAEWEAVAALSASLLTFVCVYCLFDAAALVFSSALRGAGDTAFVSAVSVVLSFGLMVVPSVVGDRLGWGVHTAWAIMSGFPVALALVLFWRFARGKWLTMRVIGEPPLVELGASPRATEGVRA